MKKLGISLLLLVGFVGMFAPTPVFSHAYDVATEFFIGTTDAQYQELEAREQKKAEYEKQIENLKYQEKNLQNQISYLQYQQSLTLLKQEETRTGIENTLRLIESVLGDIGSLATKQSNLTISIDDIEKVLSSRVRSSYKLGSEATLFALAPQAYSESMLHAKYFQSLQLLDVDLFEKMVGTRHVYEVQQSELETLKTEQETLKEKLENQNILLNQQNEDLINQKATQSWLLTTTKNQESTYQTMLAQIKEEIRSIKVALTSVGTKIGEVKQGDVIAHVGNTGCSTGAHLHFGYYTGGVAIDPLPKLNSGEFNWPVKSYAVNNWFNDSRTASWYLQNFGISGHNGIDMVDSSVGEGAPIFAVADGVAYQVSDTKACSFTGTVGKGIRIDHSDGTKTIYWHVQ